MLSTRCTAFDEETGKRCSCLKCTLPDNPDPERPLRCLECFHGPSHHCGDTSSTQVSSNPGKRSAYEILRGLKAVKGPSTASGSRSVSLREANDEANSGLRGSQSSQGARGVGKTGASSESGNSKVSTCSHSGDSSVY